MKKKEYISYFLLAITFFFLLNLPVSFTTSMRKSLLFTTKLFAATPPLAETMEAVRLKMENESLREQLDIVRQFLASEDEREEEVKKIEELLIDPKFSEHHKKQVAMLKAQLALKAYSIDARVIFRDPAFWSSGFWVDKGERENRRLGRVIIAKNSPVTVGSILVGVVEEVEEKRSYIRLITDSQLTPSVRAERGGKQNEALAVEIEHLTEVLQYRTDLFTSQAAIKGLEELKQELNREQKTSSLVKGEVRGCSYPLWRSRSSLLKGRGFNYEFADEEGAAREIHMKTEEPLLKVGDLLITSGLDGVFPKGLEVGIVSKIAPLKEGSFAYDLEAIPSLAHFADISWVQITPPLGQSLGQ